MDVYSSLHVLAEQVRLLWTVAVMYACMYVCMCLLHMMCRNEKYEMKPESIDAASADLESCLNLTKGRSGYRNRTCMYVFM